MSMAAPANASWLAELNDAQREAVEHVHGPMLVVAGAGSGKTRVLTRRIANLLRGTGPGGHPHARPQEILAITFTNKAAAEMRERVAELVGPVADRMWVMTFHAACARILRQESERLGYVSSYSIYDQADSVRLVRHCLEHLEKDPKRFAPQSVHHLISDAKNRLVGPEQYRSEVSNFVEETVADVYELYARRLRDSQAMDFDDLLFHVVHLLENDAEVRQRWAGRFRYLLVDEYQDTNHAQYRMLRALAADHSNLFCVGDADQSIYSWRGADIRNITSFEEDFTDARVVVLDVNYRSTGHILEAANGVVRHNSERIEKDLKTVLGDGELVKVVEVEDEHAEARWVVGQVEAAIDAGTAPGEIAVFYRTNAQSRVLEDQLARIGRDYQVIGGPRFYERAEVKDAVAYLTALVNPWDAIALRRIINTPKRGIGDTTVAKLDAYADTHAEPLWEALRQAPMEGSLNAGTLKKVADFVQLVEGLREHAQQSDTVAGTIEEAYDRSGLLAALQAEDSIEAQGRIENLGELVNVAREFDQRHPGASLAEFLQATALQSSGDAADSEGGIVTLMTLHNAKGLEYPVVFITGLEEQMFPHSRSVRDGDVEEERRLAYVGITRAQRQLTLLYARSRSVFGRRAHNLPSRFLDELPDEHIEVEQLAGGRGSAGSWSGGAGSAADWGGGWGDSEPSGRTFGARAGGSSGGGRGKSSSWGSTSGESASGASGLLSGSGSGGGWSSSPRRRDAADVPALAIGDDVVHDSFGPGVVLAVERDELAVIRFEDGEERRLMLAYAPLRKA